MDPEPARLWARTGFQIGHFGVCFWFPSFCSKPQFLECFVQFPIYDVKCWAQFWSKFQTPKNQFEQRSGRLWSLNRRSKWDLVIKQQKRNTKTMSITQNQTFLSAERSVFENKREVKHEIFDGLGLLAFLWPKICNDNSEEHYILFFWLYFLVVVAQTTKTKR